MDCCCCIVIGIVVSAIVFFIYKNKGGMTSKSLKAWGDKKRYYNREGCAINFSTCIFTGDEEQCKKAFRECMQNARE
jgi:hypothetical protein